MLRDVATIGEVRLNAELNKLVEAELLFEQGSSASMSYRFKHALIQDAAYQSLVRSRRQDYHRKVAETLNERYPDVAETQPEILAHHYVGADLRDAAIPFFKAAAEKSMRRSANLEAIAHLTKAQELLNGLPEGPERLQQELALQLAIGTPLIATRGFASPEVGKVYARARKSASWPAMPRSSFPCGGDCGSSIPRGPTIGRRSSSPSNAGPWAPPRTTRISSCWPTMLPASLFLR